MLFVIEHSFFDPLRDTCLRQLVKDFPCSIQCQVNFSKIAVGSLTVYVGINHIQYVVSILWDGFFKDDIRGTPL